jgi:hypothetical protein
MGFVSQTIPSMVDPRIDDPESPRGRGREGAVRGVANSFVDVWTHSNVVLNQAPFSSRAQLCNGLNAIMKHYNLIMSYRSFDVVPQSKVDIRIRDRSPLPKNLDTSPDPVQEHSPTDKDSPPSSYRVSFSVAPSRLATLESLCGFLERFDDVCISTSTSSCR